MGLRFRPNRAGDDSAEKLHLWCAPEVLEGGPLTTQSDVYAFGIIALEIFSGRLAFHKQRQTSVRGAYARQTARTQQGQRPHALLFEPPLRHISSCFSGAWLLSSASPRRNITRRASK